MVDPKATVIAASLALFASPALAGQYGACDRCEAPQTDWPPQASAEPAPYPAPPAVYPRQAYAARTETVTRVSYSEGYLTWPGKDAAATGPGYGPGPGAPPCPPVRPGERVLSCKYVPYAQPAQEADIAPAGGVLYAEGGVGPEYIPSGGGGGGGIIVEGGAGAGSGAGASSSSSAYASASASANINASITINEQPGQPHHPKGGGSWSPGSMGGGSWGPGSMSGGTPSGGSGGGWSPGSMGGSGGGAWGSGSMPSGGSWPSGSMSGGGSSSGGGHGSSHAVSHGGHGRR